MVSAVVMATMRSRSSSFVSRFVAREPAANQADINTRAMLAMKSRVGSSARIERTARRPVVCPEDGLARDGSGGVVANVVQLVVVVCRNSFCHRWSIHRVPFQAIFSRYISQIFFRSDRPAWLLGGFIART